MQTGKRYVAPYACDTRQGSRTKADTATSFKGDAKSSRADSDFNFDSCTFSDSEPGLFSPGYMSPADELFHNGKILPLQDVAQRQSVSFAEEHTTIVQMEKMEDRARQPRRSTHLFSSVSAPASPINWHSDRKKIVPVRLRLPQDEYTGEKEETVSGTYRQIATRNCRVPREQASGYHAVYLRCRSTSSSGDTLYVRNEAHITDAVYDTKESNESNPLIRGEASGDQQSRRSRAGKNRKSITLKELLEREHAMKKLVSKRDVVPGSVGSGLDEEIRKRQGRSILQAAVSELVLPEQMPWSKIRSAAMWAKPQKDLYPHGRHYAAQRAQADKMRKKTFLPYRPGLLGCLRFNSSSEAASFRTSHSHLSNHGHPASPIVY